MVVLTKIIETKNLHAFTNSQISAAVEQLLNEYRATNEEKYPGKIMELISYLENSQINKPPFTKLLECDYWSIQHRVYSEKHGTWNSKMRQQQLYNFVDIFTECKGKVNPLFWNLICLDYSEALMNTGRAIEALAILNEMVENDDCYFKRKESQEGWGLIVYSTLLKGEDRTYCIYNAHRKLKKYKDITDEAGRMCYEQRFSFAQDLYDQLNIEDVYSPTGGQPFKGKDKIYRRWCASNILFLNGSNDIDMETMIHKDTILYNDFSFPNQTHTIQSRFFQNFLNSLTQEFISLRWLLFDTVNKPKDKVHFADNDLLNHRSSINIYNIRTDSLKMVYRMAYSLFDKIAYFLNHYYNLKIPNHKASLNHIWFEKENSNNPMKNFFTQKNNDALKALYWLSKDLYGYEKVKKPSKFVKKISHLRNMMEHSYLQVTELPESILKPESGITINSDSVKVSVGEFQLHNLSLTELESLTMNLAQKARNALLYLRYAISHEEQSTKI